MKKKTRTKTLHTIEKKLDRSFNKNEKMNQIYLSKSDSQTIDHQQVLCSLINVVRNNFLMCYLSLSSFNYSSENCLITDYEKIREARF